MTLEEIRMWRTHRWLSSEETTEARGSVAVRRSRRTLRSLALLSPILLFVVANPSKGPVTTHAAGVTIASVQIKSNGPDASPTVTITGSGFGTGPARVLLGADGVCYAHG